MINLTVAIFYSVFVVINIMSSVYLMGKPRKPITVKDVNIGIVSSLTLAGLVWWIALT